MTQQIEPGPASRVTLVRGAHRWHFACRPGEEDMLLTWARAVCAGQPDGLNDQDLSVLANRLACQRVTASPTRPGAPERDSTMEAAA